MNDNEPIVLGKVAKGKTGKPLVVLILFLFVGSIILLLPTIMNYFGDYNILELIKNGEIISFIQNHDSYMEGTDVQTKTTLPVEEEVLINNKAVIRFSNFTLNNFELTNEGISFDIITSNSINFDESNYYLVLMKNDKDLFSIKLIGDIEGKGNYTFNFNKSIDSTIDVKGIVKEIKTSEYPSFTLATDESGLGNIICKKDNRNIEYVFQNDKLISIKDKFMYNDDSDKYFEEFEKYTAISNNLTDLGAESSVSENISGFIFDAKIDLSEYEYKNNTDYNYYSLNTKSNIVKFEMNSKGYDCE